MPTDDPNDPINARLKAVNHRLIEAGVETRYLDASFPECDAPPALKKFFSTWSKAPEGIAYVHGPVGCGKTYLAVCVLKRFFGFHPKIDISCPGIFLPDDLPDRIRATIKNETSEQFLQQIIRQPGLVILDDFGLQKLDGWTGEEISRIIYRRHANRRPTLITSNHNLEWVGTNIDTRVSDRIASDRQVWRYEGPNRRIKS